MFFALENEFLPLRTTTRKTDRFRFRGLLPSSFFFGRISLSAQIHPKTLSYNSSVPGWTKLELFFVVAPFNPQLVVTLSPTFLPKWRRSQRKNEQRRNGRRSQLNPSDHFIFQLQNSELLSFFSLSSSSLRNPLQNWWFWPISKTPNFVPGKKIPIRLEAAQLPR